MAYNKSLLSGELHQWAQFSRDFRLPEWDSIPKFGLYMDQVMVLLEEYLPFISASANEKDGVITASTINNYVRLKIMPAPEKKKYSRVHIVYLLMILTLKLSLSISDVQKLLPQDAEEDTVRLLYADFCGKFHRMLATFADDLQSAEAQISTADAPDAASVRIASEYALTAAFYTLFAEKLIRLNDAASADNDGVKAE